jgi:hypothetical protein
MFGSDFTQITGVFSTDYNINNREFLCEEGGGGQ